MYLEINISGGILTVAGYAGQVDLVDYQADKTQTIRVYDDGTESLSVDPALAYWLLCEVTIPAIAHETIGEGEDTSQVRLDLNDNDVVVTPWPLKEA